MMSRRDDLSFHHEMKFRNKLVEYLTDWIMGTSIQPEQEDADALASNNLVARPIQYFPWDVDDNGKVTTADAVEMVNRIGPTPAATNLTPMHDLNGDGFVDQTEVMEVVNRIGMIQSDLSA